MATKKTEEDVRNNKIFMDLFMAHKELVSVLRNQKRLQEREIELTEQIRELNKEILS